MSEFRLLMRHKGPSDVRQLKYFSKTQLSLRNIESSSAGVTAPWRGDKTFALKHCFHCVDVSAVLENECLERM